MDKYLIDTLIDLGGIILVGFILFFILAIYIILTLIAQRKDTEYNHHINLNFDLVKEAMKILNVKKDEKIAELQNHNEYLTGRYNQLSKYKATKTTSSNKVNVGTFNFVLKIILGIIGLAIIGLLIYYIVSNPINETIVVEMINYVYG